MNLSPTTAGLDLQGRGFTRKIMRGEDRAIITTEIQGGKHLIQQTVKLDTNTTGRTSRAICLDDDSWKPLPFENYLTRYKDAIIVALNTEAFLAMGEKEQKGLLAKLALPERYDFPPETMQAVESAIGQGTIDFNGEPFALIDKAYKKLYEERTL
jgi:hypothetical protein